MSFAKNLQRILDEKGWKQRDLWSKSGIGKSTMARYLAGESQPTWANAVKIAEALNTSLDALAGREPAPQQMARKLANNYSSLDGVGRAKLIDLSDDLIASGRYSPAKSAAATGEDIGIQTAKSA